jgi:hypothetical protein
MELVSSEWLYRADTTSGQIIRTCTLPCKCTHYTLLGAGELTTALRDAGSGFHTAVVGAAAKCVLRASRERAKPCGLMCLT